MSDPVILTEFRSEVEASLAVATLEANGIRAECADHDWNRQDETLVDATDARRQPIASTRSVRGLFPHRGPPTTRRDHAI